MTAVERIKEALHLLELVDKEAHEHDGDYEFSHGIAQDENGEMIEDHIKLPMNYCPNCGARMDGDTGESR